MTPTERAAVAEAIAALEEIDLRKEFELLLVDDLMPAEFSHGYLFKRDEDDDYENDLTASRYKGWLLAFDFLKGSRGTRASLRAFAPAPADEVAQYQRWLRSRDDFLVEQGLWQKFVDQLPAAPADQSEAVGRGEDDIMAVPLNELVRQATEMQAGGRYINGRIFHGLVDEIERLEKLALPTADRDAIREALKEGLRLVGD